MSRDRVVVSIGGSILIPDHEDSVFIKELAQMITELNKEVQLVVICGGGKIARYYTNTSAELGASVFEQDLLGIGTTRLNAKLLALALGDISSTEIPLNAADAANMSVPGKVVVMGGTEPGHTTDAVASMVAKEMEADRVVNATSVDAVHTHRPKKKTRSAKRLGKILIKELGNWCTKYTAQANRMACSISRRSDRGEQQYRYPRGRRQGPCGPQERHPRKGYQGNLRQFPLRGSRSADLTCS